jgi:2,4-dienoyl-CoA reductase-like NADH-dependent reductase (Old Yellow Enzyme family)
MSDLFSSYDLNGLALENRLVLSPMTRTRATEDNVPTELMRDYFVQRASPGLLVHGRTQTTPSLTQFPPNQETK